MHLNQVYKAEREVKISMKNKKNNIKKAQNLKIKRNKPNR